MFRSFGTVLFLRLLTFCFLGAAALFTTSGAACFGEDSESKASSVKQDAESWRKNPPALPAPRPFKMPPVTEYKLDNGLLVELLEDHRVPFITVEVGIKAGAAHDPENMLGLSSMTASMLTEGTTSKKSREIAEEVDFIGGALTAVSDADFTVIVGSALSRYTDRLLTELSDVLLNPSFPEDELKLKKTNLLQELVMKRSEPGFLVNERFSSVVFGKHPYAVVAPKPETVERIQRLDLVDFHKKFYLPNKSVLIVVGDFNTDSMKGLITKCLGSAWMRATMEIVKSPLPPKQSGRRIYLVDRPGSVQSSIMLGNIGIKRTDPDYFPFMVCNQILGGGGNARLFLNIREQKGYTYGAYSKFSARKDPGAFDASAEVRTEVTAPSLQEFIYELERLRNVKVSDKELSDAKAHIAGAFQLGLETQAGLVQKLIDVKMYELPANYLETFTDNVMAVTKDKVQEVARKYIDLDNIVITVVGDGAKIKNDLQYFGPVEVYDTQGKLEKSQASSK